MIDFEDLGELIYKHSSGFLTKDDIIRKITQMQETPAAVQALKEEIKSNYQKYFKKTFADQDFEGKWKYWEQLRNKIAHTNLFTSEDLIKGKTVADELIKIIRAADESTAGLIISPDEREAIREQIIQKTENSESDSSAPDSKWKSINEAELLSELREQESYHLKRPYGFVGLSWFVRKHLLSKGYPLGPSYSQMEHLIKAGKIEVYYVENPFDDETPTAALRSLSTPSAA